MHIWKGQSNKSARGGSLSKSLKQTTKTVQNLLQTSNDRKREKTTLLPLSKELQQQAWCSFQSVSKTEVAGFQLAHLV